MPHTAVLFPLDDCLESVFLWLIARDCVGSASAFVVSIFYVFSPRLLRKLSFGLSHLKNCQFIF